MCLLRFYYCLGSNHKKGDKMEKKHKGIYIVEKAGKKERTPYGEEQAIKELKTIAKEEKVKEKSLIKTVVIIALIFVILVIVLWPAGRPVNRPVNQPYVIVTIPAAINLPTPANTPIPTATATFIMINVPLTPTIIPEMEIIIENYQDNLPTAILTTPTPNNGERVNSNMPVIIPE